MIPDNSYAGELAKEFLRDAFMKGTLDITDSFESVRGFIQIFAGEMECLVAINNCRFLSGSERKELFKAARLTRREAEQYQAWLSRVCAD